MARKLKRRGDEARYVRHPDIKSRAIGTELLLVPTRSSIVDLESLFTANESAAFVWKLLDKPRTCREIASALAAKFAVKESAARRDVAGFLACLVEEGCAAAIGPVAPPP